MKTRSLVDLAQRLEKLERQAVSSRALWSNVFIPLQQDFGLSAEHLKELERYGASHAELVGSQEQLVRTLQKVLAEVLFRTGDEDDLVPQTPPAAQQSILRAVRHLAQDAKEIHSSPKQLKSNLDPSKHALYELYRMLQAASSKAMEAALTGLNENGATLAFVQELARLSSLAERVAPALAVVPHLFMTSLNTGTVETDVGADFALVVAGVDLLGAPGARVFWVQAKRALDADFLLDVSRKSSASCMFRQVSSLIAMETSDGRSNTMHLQFGRGVHCLDATWSVSSARVKLENKLHSSAHHNCKGLVEANRCTMHADLPEVWDISTSACRFAEQVVLQIGLPGECFRTVEEFEHFFQRLPSANRVNVSKHLVVLCPTGDKAALALADGIVWTLYDRPGWRLTPHRIAKP